MFFDNWADIGRVAASALIMYVGLIVMLRIAGKRTLSEMNSFDFLVTVSLGSIVSSTLLSTDTPLAEGFVALLVLMSLQYVVTSIAARSPRFLGLIKNDESLLYYRGAFLETAMRRERITREEIEAAARLAGKARMDEVDAVVLENEGKLSILSGSKAGPIDLVPGIDD